MPRPRTLPSITPGQALYVVQRLIRDRRITGAEVTAYVGDLAREITALEARLDALRRAAGITSGERPATAPDSPSSTDNTRRRPGRPRKNREGAPAAERLSSKAATNGRKRGGRTRAFTVTPKVLASREVQGRYLPLLSKFTGAKRAHYAKLAKTDGREAAITEMQTALKS